MLGWRRKTHIIVHVAASCRSEGFNSEYLSLFHFGLVGVLYKGDRLSTMNTVLLDIMTGEIPYGLDWEILTADLNLVALHGFLDGSADITYPHVNSSGLERSLALAPAFHVRIIIFHLDTGVRGILDRS